jgi:hypothetical protein
MGSWLSTLALALGALLLCGGARAQSSPEAVGRIEGEDVAVKGQVTLVRDAGRNAALLVSGSEVTVRAGQARITLDGGGEIDVCGAAKFTLLKSDGSLTLALHYGCVRLRLASAPQLNVFSAVVSATALDIADGPRDAVLSLETDGSMCVAALRGVVRLEHQLSGQSLVVPQNGEIEIPGGEWEALKSGTGRCRCEVSLPASEPPAAPRTQSTTLTRPALPAEAPAEKQEPPKPSPPATEQPVWKVMMPPLTFRADAPAAEPREEIVWLVREARVQPAAVFTGRVEPRPAPVKTAKARREMDSPGKSEQPSRASSESSEARAERESPAAQVDAAGEGNRVGFGTRLKNFFRRLFGRKT